MSSDPEEITARRINIVDDNGVVRLRLFNGSSVPSVVLNGQTVPRNVSMAGMAGFAFYNEGGEECGGLIYGNRRAILAFDQYQQDEILGLSYHEGADGKRRYGFYVEQRPEIPMLQKLAIVEPVMAMDDGPDKTAAIQRLVEQGLWGDVPRVMIEKTAEGEAVLGLADSKGRTRVRMTVDADDTPRIEFLDASGEVTYRLPPDDPGALG